MNSTRLNMALRAKFNSPKDVLKKLGLDQSILDEDFPTRYNEREFPVTKQADLTSRGSDMRGSNIGDVDFTSLTDEALEELIEKAQEHAEDRRRGSDRYGRDRRRDADDYHRRPMTRDRRRDADDDLTWGPQERFGEQGLGGPGTPPNNPPQTGEDKRRSRDWRGGQDSARSGYDQRFPDAARVVVM